MVSPISNPVFKQIGNYRYDINQKPIGAGAFGVVYSGSHYQNTRELVAIKQVPRDIVRRNENLFTREIDIMQRISGKHIVKLKEIVRTDTDNLYIITELCDYNLRTYMETKRSIREYEALYVVKQIAEAFAEIGNLDLKDENGKYLSLFHRDLKPENILILDGQIKLADFGFAKLVETSKRYVPMRHSIIGTPAYMEPSIVNRQSYSGKCDVWSMGQVLYELIIGTRKQSDGLFEFRNKFTPECADLLNRMLIVESRERIMWQQILEHFAITSLSESIELRLTEQEQTQQVQIQSWQYRNSSIQVARGKNSNRMSISGEPKDQEDEEYKFDPNYNTPLEVIEVPAIADEGNLQEELNNNVLYQYSAKKLYVGPEITIDTSPNRQFEYLFDRDQPFTIEKNAVQIRNPDIRKRTVKLSTRNLPTDAFIVKSLKREPIEVNNRSLDKTNMKRYVPAQQKSEMDIETSQAAIKRHFRP